jgi:RHS repeat-associated protein
MAAWPASHGEDAAGSREYTGTRVTKAGCWTYVHDEAGRVIERRKTRLSRKPDVWRYEWDAEDRLTTCTTPDGTVWTYCYDPLGRRSAKKRLDTEGRVVEETVFTWDGTQVIEQWTTGVTDRPIALTWEYNGLAAVAQAERALDPDTQQAIDTRFFAIITDLVGTPTELVTPDGGLAWRTRSTLWGTTAVARGSSAHTPLRHPGQYADTETGLHYNLNRHYDPATARYTSPDPLGLVPDPNPVAWVHNPCTWADPLGLEGKCASIDRSVVDHLDRTQTKYSKDELVAAQWTKDGKAVFLEKGNQNAGLEHIMRHAGEFEGKGVSREKVPELVMQAATRGEKVGMQGTRPIYEVEFEGQTRRVAVTVGNNGFVVGANPKSIP